jgi:hypothetical protein
VFLLKPLKSLICQQITHVPLLCSSHFDSSRSAFSFAFFVTSLAVLVLFCALMIASASRLYLSVGNLLLERDKPVSRVQSHVVSDKLELESALRSECSSDQKTGRVQW